MRIALVSTGCRTNQVEINSLHSELLRKGHSIEKGYNSAEIIIINTCSVTGNTEAKTRRFIRHIAKENPNANILVTGCLAQQKPEELLKIEGVLWVVGNSHKTAIPDILMTRNKGIYCTSSITSSDPVTLLPDNILQSVESPQTRFSMKIQEGCNFKCSYCIVPLLRGASRSVKKEIILLQCLKAIESGYKEIVLTGTHIGQYSDSISYILTDLINDILKIPGDFRLRLSSLDPRDCTDNLLELFSCEEKLCKHIHLSIQSMSQEVLSGMNRLYKGYDLFIDRIDSFMRKNPDTAIGGDFITGFPGESTAMFEINLEMIQKTGFAYGHLFRYSKRPGTVAATFKNQVPEKEKSERSNIIRKVLSELRKKFIATQTGEIVHRIIVEKDDPVQGITSNYIRVEIPDIKINKNEWYNVFLKHYICDGNYCIGESAFAKK